MDFLTGLLGGLDGLSSLYSAYQSTPQDNFLKRMFTSSSAGTGQTLEGENALRSYFGYAPTSVEASGSTPGSFAPSDNSLLRSYFGYGPGQQDKGYRFGGAGGGSQKTSDKTSQNDAASTLTKGVGGNMNGSKRDFSGLLAGLWQQPMTSSEIAGAIGMNANTGMYPMNYKGM